MKKAIIFDCDGVILDSNNLKIDAFEKIASAYGTVIQKKFLEYVKDNFGKSRYHFFEYLLKDLVNDYNKENYDKALAQYSYICYESYLKCPLTTGAENLLNSLHTPAFIATGSDEKELIKVFKKRGLDKFFKEIFGSPLSKDKIVEKIIKQLPNYSFVMFGDSYNDLAACKDVENVQFVYVSDYSLQKRRFEKIECEKIRTLEEAMKFI